MKVFTKQWKDPLKSNTFNNLYNGGSPAQLEVYEIGVTSDGDDFVFKNDVTGEMYLTAISGIWNGSAWAYNPVQFESLNIGATTPTASIASDGSVSFSSGNFTVSAAGAVAAGTADFASGTLVVSSSTVTADGTTFYCKNGGSNMFAVTGSTGAISAAGGNFSVDSTGYVGAPGITVAAGKSWLASNGAARIADGAFTIATTGTVSIGSGNISLDPGGTALYKGTISLGVSGAKTLIRADGSVTFSNFAFDIDTAGNIVDVGSITSDGTITTASNLSIGTTASFAGSSFIVTANGSLNWTSTSFVDNSTGGAYFYGNLVGGATNFLYLNSDGTVNFGGGAFRVDVTGWTQLGLNAPYIKMALLTGTTADSVSTTISSWTGDEGGIIVAHGMVELTSGTWVGPGTGTGAASELQCVNTGTSVQLFHAGSGLRLKPYKILLIYRSTDF